MTLIKPELWLNEQLGKPAYSVSGLATDLVFEDLPRGQAFVEARIDASDSVGLAHLQNLGFRVIDCNLTLERMVEQGSMPTVNLNLPATVRVASASDEFGVRSLARKAFEQNRFHRDPFIPNDLAAQIKEAWVGSFFKGTRGDWMVVAEDSDGIGGFLQLLRAEDGALVIDLVAVASRCRRQGLAQTMTAYAYENCLKEWVNMRVGTQLGNSASLQLYQRMGFSLRRAAYLLHRHT